MALLLLASFARAQEPFNVHQLHALTRVSPAIYKNNEAVYSVRFWDEKTRKTDIHLEGVNLGTNTIRRIVRQNNISTLEYSPSFSPDGSVIAYQGDDDNTIYQVVVSTGVASVLAKLPVPVTSFKFSASGNYLVFSAKIYLSCADPVLDCTANISATQAAKGPNTAWVYNQLYVRHWDAWETEGLVSHIFSLPIKKSTQGEYVVNGAPLDLLKGLSYNAPVPPFGDGGQYDTSVNDELAFTAEKVDHETAWGTGWEVGVVALSGGRGRFVPSPVQGARCQDPHWSPVGKPLALLCMRLPGHESDKLSIYTWDQDVLTPHTLQWDRSVGGYAWAKSNGNREFLVDSDDDGDHKIFYINANGKDLQIHTLVSGGDNTDLVWVSDSTWVFSRNSLSAPADIYKLTISGTSGSISQLTKYNSAILSKVFMSAPQKFYFASPNGDKVQGWLLKPIGFKNNTKYPLAFLIHGGPEGAWTDAWSYRWNPQLWASRGYAVVAVNPHGSSGFGQAFQEGVLHQWGGLPFQDLMAGNDYVLRTYDWVDGSRQCACGASYGGYMINWINGNDHRFNCLVVHDGVFSSLSMYYSSEEVFFNEAEFGPPPYTSAAARQAYEQWSPVNHVDSWVTPTLVVHGGNDFRIPVAEGLGAFTALQRKGVPSRLLLLPLENHWTLYPPNSITWYDEVLGWLDKWTAVKGENVKVEAPKTSTPRPRRTNKADVRILDDQFNVHPAFVATNKERYTPDV